MFVVCYIESGKVVEKGSFNELVALKGKFFETVKLQGISD